ncbi:Hypothetical protein I595_1621 [Croceitalea dokdonensis DOKDO 023]|uniref:Uncharacterized protein n=1 Tax=Croceitalea dokdonensis DOKDO 023 TaxID=1300341 RepID=A0A0P7A5U2_9FLAO|nr:hypothetical protein [Croceitalea dokdonensis]KPM31973.1 Hypothetical protein I595_1621 [Croceitalea dokdonensis DOKDO 023]
MLEITTIYNALSNTERKEFESFLASRNRRSDVKNLRFLKLLAAGRTKEISTRLYGKPSTAAFHALCKRIYDALIDFVASKSFAEETQGELEVLKLLLASRLFLEQKLYKTAFKTLSKAEEKGLLLDNYSILNEIYLTQIQHAHLNTKWVLADIIRKYESNQLKAQVDVRLGMAYAEIKATLGKTNTNSVQELVNSAFERYQVKVSKDLNFKSLQQLFEITATTAKLQQDFYSVGPFMQSLFAMVKQKGPVKEKHRFNYLNILYFMAVTAFRNKRFRESEGYLADMQENLSLGKKSYHDVFSEKMLELTALNQLYQGGLDRAVHLLKEATRPKLNRLLLLSMCFFLQEDFANGYKVMTSFQHSDGWYLKKAGWIWVLKKNLIEILLLMELDKPDMVIQRLDRFFRNFRKPLLELGEQRVLVFMDLAQEIYEHPKKATTPIFMDKVERSFTWLGRDREDIFVMTFYAWLKAKMENKALYEVVLDLVNIEDQ